MGSSIASYWWIMDVMDDCVNIILGTGLYSVHVYQYYACMQYGECIPL